MKANYQLGLLLARMGRKEEADKQLELAKSLREEDEETSRCSFGCWIPTDEGLADSSREARPSWSSPWR